MSAEMGYGKIVTSGSIFCYDTNDIYNSYKGEPTTNIYYVQYPTLPTNYYWTNSGTASFNFDDKNIDKPNIPNVTASNLVVCSGTTLVQGNHQLGTTPITVLPSTAYALSVWWRYTGTGMSSAPYVRQFVNNNQIGTFVYNGDSNHLNWPRNKWIRLQATCSTSGSETGLFISSYFGDYVGEKVYYYAPQIEQKTHVTPLVLGNRPTSQSLFPIIGSASLNLSNVSFNSTAEITFNGSSSYIAWPNDTIFDNQTLTIEVVCYPTNLSQAGFFFEKGNVNTQYSFFLEGGTIIFRTMGLSVQDSTQSTNVMNVNRWNHMVATFGNGVKNIYVNGLWVKTDTGVTGTISTNTGGQSIGAFGGMGGGGRAYYFAGKIAVVRIYRRALSIAEVRRNYNVYQRRFNI